ASQNASPGHLIVCPAPQPLRHGTRQARTARHYPNSHHAGRHCLPACAAGTRLEPRATAQLRTMGARAIGRLIVAFPGFGTAWGGALLNAAMGPWTAWGLNHDGTTTHMAFGQNLPRPDFIVLYPGAYVVQGSLLTSSAMPSGVGKLDIGTRAGFGE